MAEFNEITKYVRKDTITAASLKGSIKQKILHCSDKRKKNLSVSVFIQFGKRKEIELHHLRSFKDL
jgi:hypothetical protein